MSHFRHRHRRNNSMDTNIDFNGRKSSKKRIKHGSVIGGSDYSLRKEKAVEGIISLGPEMFSVVSSSHKRTNSTGYLLGDRQFMKGQLSANNSIIL